MNQQTWKSTTFGVVLLVLVAACERPPIETQQVGPRGTAMAILENPRDPQPALDIPASPAPAAPGGPLAGEIYENVEVLGDLSVAEFTRTMLAITEWVAPEQGCNYCHNPANLAEEGLYTKTVSRRMLQMTQALNDEWSPHTGATGVTCYTCHRGKNVPENIWFNGSPAAGSDADGGNYASAASGYTSMPGDSLAYFLTGNNRDKIRLASSDWQPTRQWKPTEDISLQESEMTYALMLHLSDSLGVNCTYCHNTRAFADWSESNPQRVTAWHGLNMVDAMNADYLVPLGPVYPENRLGPHGDAPKANCATCHAGQNKPLGGVNMVKDFPGLQ